MFADLTRRGTHPRTAALKAGTSLRRLAVALAAVTVGLLASAATIPAAFAREGSVPPSGSGYELGRFGPAFPATTSAASTGMPGWQITLIALGTALAAAAFTIVLARARAAHRAVPSPAA
jgi:hypothetical protein